ncbi:MAG: SDR family oxidoreductase, partial [Gammaproteobacteria bacterium]
MTERLQNKLALVTAAGQGIGRATALAFAAEGARVVATDIDEPLLAELAGEHAGIVTQQMDVTLDSDVARLASRYPQVDVLFNCAGFVHNGSVLECSEDELNFCFDLNLTSMYRTIRAWLPSMLEAGSGSIINMASVASSIRGVPDRFAYGVTKAAVIGLTRSIAADFVAHGIRCNAICPGTVASPSLEQRIAAQPDPTAARAAFIARQPMGRLGTPEEIAALAVYL